MAAKNTLKYKRNQLPPILVIVDELIHTCLRAIASQDFKATISDFIRLIRLRPKMGTPTAANDGPLDR